MSDTDKKPVLATGGLSSPLETASRSELPDERDGGFLGFGFEMTPVGAAPDVDDLPAGHWVHQLSFAAISTAWALFAASLFLPAIALPELDYQNTTPEYGFFVLLTSLIFCFVPTATPFAICNLAIISSPWIWQANISEDLGRVYACTLTVAACVVVPWVFAVERPIGMGCIFWGLSFYFSSAAFLIPVMYRRYAAD